MIAIFDLDYTLTKRGTWGRFVWSTVRTRPWLWLPLLGETLANQLAYKSGRTPRGAVKTSMMRWSLMHRKRRDLEAMAERFAEAEVADGLRPGALAALAFHRQRGDTILIATAAVDLVALPIARRLGVDNVVSTQLDWDAQRLRPTFASKNCYGAAKRAAVERWIEQAGRVGEPSVFYTDSRADFPMIALVSCTVVVDPKSKTRAEARTRDLPIQSWKTCETGFCHEVVRDVSLDR